MREKLYEFDYKGKKHVIYITPLWFEVEVFDEKGRKQTTRINDISTLQSFLKVRGVEADFLKDVDKEEISSEYDFEAPLMKELQSFFSQEMYYGDEYAVLQPGDRVYSTAYPNRKDGVVELVELSGMRRYPIVLVRWLDDGNKVTWELPFTLRRK